MRLFLSLVITLPLMGQISLPKGRILPPSGDATLNNIIVGSAVAPDGTFGDTAQVYLVKADGTSPQKLTSFDESNHAVGATAVAMAQGGTRAAYIALVNANGITHEEVHTIDLGSGTDRLIATNQNNCGSTSCLGPITFSQDGAKVLWGYASASGGSAAYNSRLFVADFEGSAVTQLPAGAQVISGPNNVTGANGRFIYDDYECSGDMYFCEGVGTANLDGSGPSLLVATTSLPGRQYVDPVISGSGTANAYVLLNPDNDQVLFYGIATSAGACSVPGDYSAAAEKPISSLSISSDGSTVVGIRSGQILNCNGTAAGPKQLFAFDVQLSADGSRMLYSAGPDGSRRAAVWIAHVDGSNARPVFAPRSIYQGGIVGLGSVSASKPCPQCAPNPGNIVPLSPGSYFTIYGANFIDQDSLTTAATLPLPIFLNGVTVQVNGTAIPVQAVTPGQINALLPQDSATGTANVTVVVADGGKLTASAPVAPAGAVLYAVPGSYSFLDLANGFFFFEAAAFHAGTGTLADPSHPADRGEILETYGFGLGVTTPTVEGGSAAPANPPAAAPAPFVSIDGFLAQTTFAGLVPGLAGLYQVNVVVPQALPTGIHLMSWFTKAPVASGQAYFYSR